MNSKDTIFVQGMTEREDYSGDSEMRFVGIFKSLDAVKECLRSEKYVNLTEVQELLKIFSLNYSEKSFDRAIDRDQRKLFIVLEGMDASGKTTICRRLCGLLNGKQLCTPPKEMLSLREKFDSHPAELRRAYYALGNYLAASQVREVYKTDHVVMDRFWHSTAAYALGLDCVEKRDGELPVEGDPVYDWPNDLLKPDIVFFLSVSEEKRTERLMNRKNKPITQEELKMKADKPLREAVMTAYSFMHKPSQIQVDSNVTVEEVLRQLKNTLEKRHQVQLPEIEDFNPDKVQPQGVVK